MREKHQKQMPLIDPPTGHPKEKELEAISTVLDSTPTICDHVLQDLNKGKIIKRRTGARGMTAEQIIRAAVVMRLYSFTYEDLAFHISDSRALRRFCRIGIADKGFKKSALNANIKTLSPQTWQRISDDLLIYAKDEKIEKGRKARIDCTVVESNIHKPFDSVQLFDAVRVIARLLTKARDDFGIKIVFTDHRRRAKKRMIGIQYAKGEKQRTPCIKICSRSLAKPSAMPSRPKKSWHDIAAQTRFCWAYSAKSNTMETWPESIRPNLSPVVQGESVPAGQKVFSIFEDHTDIIIKDRRDTHYGHKICLTGGASNLILDCVILEGNPADTELVETMLDRQKRIYGRYPLKVALDGGFASKDNLVKAKARKIKDVCFSKKRGLKEADMCRSDYVYKKLRQFRAGIESGISWLKRSFGLTRCTWKGFRSFKCYVLSSVVAANLLTIARKKLAVV
jgi:IS5 family transposase